MLNYLKSINGALVVCSIGFASFFAYLSAFGIEFSDEGFYLNWIAHPLNYKISYTHFGYLYAPIFEVLGKNIVYLRIVSNFILYLLGWFFTYVALSRLLDLRTGLQTILIALPIASLVMLFHAKIWLITPSYNSAIYSAILVSSTFAILLCNPNNKNSKINLLFWLGLSTSGVIAVLAKPTSAALLGLILIAVTILQRSFAWKHFALATLWAVFLVTLFAVSLDGSPFFFFERVSNGLLVIQLRDAGYGLNDFGLERFFTAIPFFENWVYAYICLATIISLQLFHYISLLQKWPVFLLIFITPAAVAINVNHFPWLALYPIAVGSLISSIISKLRQPGKLNDKLIVWSGIFIVLPLVYSFGTNGQLWEHAQSASFFILLAIILLVVSHVKIDAQANLFTTIAAFSLLCSINVIYESASNPYRQTTSLFKMETSANYAYGKITTNEDTANFISSYMYLAQENNFELGTGIIDFSGRTPAIPFLIGGINVGTPWMNGGYPGGLPSALQALSYVDCKQLHKAWLILEDEGPRELAFEGAEEINLNLGDYEFLGSIAVPYFLAGHRLTGTQSFFKPKKNKHIKHCKDIENMVNLRS